MSSTNKTSIGLNLWDESDKPQMADFNSDNELIDALFMRMAPIGYMFEWSPVSGSSLDLSTAQKVHDHYGFGTWALLGVGRTAVCIDTSDPDFDTAGKTAGSKTHYNTLPLYMAGDNLVSQSFALNQPLNGIKDVQNASGDPVSANATANSPNAQSISGTSQAIGISGFLLNSFNASSLQPSIAVYRWQRIA